MIALGIDPDTRYTGMALVTLDKVLAIGGIRSDNGLIPMCQRIFHGIREAMVLARPDVIVVEGQQIYRNTRVDGNNVLQVAAVAGAALAVTEGCSKVLLPRPRDWKGQRPKGVDQKNTLRHYGWKFLDNGPTHPPSWTVPAGLKTFGDPIPVRHKKEIVDAMGLARWGLDE